VLLERHRWQLRTRCQNLEIRKASVDACQYRPTCGRCTARPHRTALHQAVAERPMAVSLQMRAFSLNVRMLQHEVNATS
jgi:hypothetical protein